MLNHRSLLAISRSEGAMSQLFRFCLALILLGVPIGASAQDKVAAWVESSLKTSGGQIRQYAFDGDANSYFLSDGNATAGDHFTLNFDKPVSVKAIAIVTGKPKGGDALDLGVVEGSADGKMFEELAKFNNGTANAKFAGRNLVAIRLKPAADLNHAVAIQEITVDSDPPVTTFKYPVEISVKSEDMEMKEWVEKTARICEKFYPNICEELRSDGFKPPTRISMTLKNDYRGVAATGGNRITGSVKYFKEHTDDVGAMIHETVHAVQQYRTPNNPGWLVEGIADYVRFFKYEPGKLGRINAERAHYNGSYRITAAFLAYVTEKYNPELVRKLNQSMREGEYKETIWQALTKKSLTELDEEWRASLLKK
jgi:hypothetical protein